MKIVLLGAQGQLGQTFHSLLTLENQELLALSRKDLDVTDHESLKNLLHSKQPDVLINCSAYNYVDLAEENQTLAYQINEQAVEHMAALCQEAQIKFVHFSTDYVFDGSAQKAYIESDPTNPVNIYGKSKRAGEKSILKKAGNYLIFRSSWVYGNGRQNFLFKFLSWAQQKDELLIAYDETSIPCSTEVIAQTAWKAIQDDLHGFFHMTCSGYCSRYEFASEIARLLKLKTKLTPVSKDIFSLKAKRGDFLALDNTKISEHYRLPHWKEELTNFLKNKLGL